MQTPLCNQRVICVVASYLPLSTACAFGRAARLHRSLLLAERNGHLDVAAMAWLAAKTHMRRDFERARLKQLCLSPYRWLCESHSRLAEIERLLEKKREQLRVDLLMLERAQPGPLTRGVHRVLLACTAGPQIRRPRFSLWRGPAAYLQRRKRERARRTENRRRRTEIATRLGGDVYRARIVGVGAAE